MTKARDFQVQRKRLEEQIAEAAGKKTFNFDDRRMLMRALSEAASAYNRIQWSAEDASLSTFHELGAPLTLARMIEILKHEANRESVLVALGAPVRDPSIATRLTWPEHDRPVVERAMVRHAELLSALDDLARAVPSPPPTRPPWRPVENNDLCAAVEVFADYWERATGLPVTQDWYTGNGKGSGRIPNSPFARFAHDAMKFMGVKRLNGLPELTKKIVTARRGGRGRRSKAPRLRQPALAGATFDK
jgi:hypothetical protein